MKMKRSRKAIDYLQEISIRKASPENPNHNRKNISTPRMHNLRVSIHTSTLFTESKKP